MKHKISERATFVYEVFAGLASVMREQRKMFVFVDKGQVGGPYELWESLSSVSKSKAGGGVAILDLKAKKLLTKPSMSKKKITAGFKKIFPELESKHIMRKLKMADDYAVNYKEIHQGRFLTYLD
jgi:hypothetical protein